jgi:glyoxylase-like metal-dependent hydrolase (beta-lactamase superfamily II)
MFPLSPGIDYVDVNFLGYPNIIATAVLHGPGGAALIDPGPSTSLSHLQEALERGGLRMHDVRQILLTHIHLDHAGAAGSIVKAHPHIEVFVHERGAPHLSVESGSRPPGGRSTSPTPPGMRHTTSVFSSHPAGSHSSVTREASGGAAASM